MNDHDLLEVIAADAPQPDARHAEAVLQVARRARRRRRSGALFAATAGTAAVAIVATAALHGSGDDRQHATVPAKSPVVSMKPHLPSSSATAYATAVRTIARAGGGTAPHVLYVLDHTCANVITQQPGGCHARALPPALRSDLRQALAGYAPVTFIADARTVTGSPQDGLTVKNGGAVITLGPAEMEKDTATVPLSVRRGGLDGRGLTYLLSRQDSGWKVTGTTGADWIS